MITTIATIGSSSDMVGAAFEICFVVLLDVGVVFVPGIIDEIADDFDIGDIVEIDVNNEISVLLLVVTDAGLVMDVGDVDVIVVEILVEVVVGFGVVNGGHFSSLSFEKSPKQWQFFIHIKNELIVCCLYFL